jgi:hypothetical protein
MDLDSAITILEAKGFIVITRPEINDQYEENIVIRTEPPAGTAVKQGEMIVVIYSKKSATITVPKLINLTLETAERVIDENDLVLGEVEVNPAAEGLPKNQQYVLLTDPVEGTPVTRKSQINLYIGTAEDALRGGTPTPTPTPAPYMLSVTTSEGGTVEGGGSYLEGLTVTVRATPLEGYVFVKWVDSANVTISETAEVSFIMPSSDYSIRAVFEMAPVTPTPSPSPTPTPTPTPTPSPTPAQNTNT